MYCRYRAGHLIVAVWLGGALGGSVQSGLPRFYSNYNIGGGCG